MFRKKLSDRSTVHYQATNREIISLTQGNVNICQVKSDEKYQNYNAFSHEQKKVSI